MAGRAFRTKYFPTCHVFSTTGAGTEGTVCQNIQRSESEPFGGGDRSLKLIKLNAEKIGKVQQEAKVNGLTLPPLKWTEPYDVTKKWIEKHCSGK